MTAERSVEAMFREWDLGCLMLSRIEAYPRTDTMHRLAAAAARCFDRDESAQNLDLVISTAINLILPIDSLIDEGAPIAAGISPVRTALAAVATAGLLAERTACLARDQALCRAGMVLIGQAMREVAAGQEWDWLNDGTEAGYWRAVQGKAEAGAVLAVSLGALVSRAPDQCLPALRSIARALGRLDQIEDDLTDFATEPPSADWRRPHCNLLLLYGTREGTAHGPELRALIERASDRPARERIRSRLLALGAAAYAAHAAEICLASARAGLSVLSAAAIQPLACELQRREAVLARLFGRQTARATAGRTAAEPGPLHWPLLDTLRRPNGPGAPSDAIIADIETAVRLLREWRDHGTGIHREIGGGRTANLAVGLIGAAFERCAALPLGDELWRKAVLEAACGLVDALRELDPARAVPIVNENGGWRRSAT